MNEPKSERYQPASQVHARRFDDEVVVLDLAAGEYYSLDKVGSAIWEHLAAGRSVDEIVALLLEAYEVDESTARDDVRHLTRELVDAGLVERRS